MSRFRSNYERGNTVISTYSSIHSADAYVGDYQVMYTPGSSPRAQQKKPSGRFRTRHRDGTASIVIPANIPNTSQILPDRGTLPDVHFHYSVPPDEKEIVMSLRAVQRQLNAAMETIDQLERERDQAIHELNVMRATNRKSTTPAQKKEQVARVEEELFDISRVEDSPQKSPARSNLSKRALGHKNMAKTNTENDARIISSAAAQQLPVMTQEHDDRAGAKHSHSTKERRSSRRATVQDTEESMLQDPTAASNISRRRRGHSLDENMTSAYIIPDITLAMKQQKEQQEAFKPSISKEAQGVLHDHDPQHIEGCEVCQRLTSKKHVQIKAFASSRAHSGQAANAGNDYTAQITALMKDIALEEPTFRPKIAPEQALAHLKKLLTDQYNDAKKKHGEAWEEYDDIDAPKSSKRHAAVGEAMGYWARKMEECRVNLDQLRDVEEGMRRAEIV
jgi:hypothetical protein